MMKKILIKGILSLFFPIMLLNEGCNKALLDDLATQPIAALPGDSVSFEDDSLEIYVPKEFKDMNLYNNASTWSYDRSKESQHFIVFWGAGYGRNQPNSSAVPETYRVDIDDLLAKAEQFYDINVKRLKFAEREVGKSNLDKYKMMIFLHYTTEWMAYGGGYDDVIGALWINPATCKPVGSTIAHEIGHSFQYQVRCDLGPDHGLRYGFGGNGGNSFWEQTAQWQAHQTYPMEAFNSYNFTVYTENYHRHIHHEWYRYASYFIHDYWASRHGIDIVGRVWRAAKAPEDPLQAYMRLTGISVAQFNNEIYDAATKFVTWDLDALRSNGANYIGKQTNAFRRQQSGAFRVAYNRCPGTTGYNVVPLVLAPAGTVLTTHFKGLPNAPGFNPVDAGRAGWRYGYVALSENGTRTYGTMNSATEGDVAFTVPANCKNLWFVVSGAPTVYTPHAWDENEANDEQWPYELTFTNTSILNFVNIGEQPQNVTFNLSVELPLNGGYTATQVVVDKQRFAENFAMQYTELKALLDAGKVKFYAVEEDNKLNERRTANGYGHWLDDKGNVVDYGDKAFFYSEFDENGLLFNIGQFPERPVAGNYTLKQALVYEYQSGKTAQATFQFNIVVK